jgi:hypothetical protein
MSVLERLQAISTKSSLALTRFAPADPSGEAVAADAEFTRPNPIVCT